MGLESGGRILIYYFVRIWTSKDYRFVFFCISDFVQFFNRGGGGVINIDIFNFKHRNIFIGGLRLTGSSHADIFSFLEIKQDKSLLFTVFRLDRSGNNGFYEHMHSIKSVSFLLFL